MNWIDRRKQKARRRLARAMGTALVAALALLIAIGLLLPREHDSTSSALLGRTPETIWRVLTDVDGMPLWRSDVSAVERLPDLLGKPVWREIGRGGARILEVSVAEPPRRLVIQSAAEGEPRLPRRTFELVSVSGGTQLIVTERAASRNPLTRVLVRLRVPRPAIERLLKDLTQRFGMNRRQVAVQPGLTRDSNTPGGQTP